AGPRGSWGGIICETNDLLRSTDLPTRRSHAFRCGASVSLQPCVEVFTPVQVERATYADKPRAARGLALARGTHVSTADVTNRVLGEAQVLRGRVGAEYGFGYCGIGFHAAECS